jgi:hypothetical protein
MRPPFQMGAFLLGRRLPRSFDQFQTAHLYRFFTRLIRERGFSIGVARHVMTLIFLFQVEFPISVEIPARFERSQSQYRFSAAHD